MAQGHSGAETNDRLLAAATEVFVEVGYRGATLREICRRAHANIAAVNYHFRDKESLYEAVLRQAVVSAGAGMALLKPDADDSPVEKLHHVIRTFLNNLLGADRPVQLLQLFAHELIEPTPAFDLAVEMAARPLTELMQSVVTELLGPAADPGLVRDCAVSVLSQCTTYHHSKAVIQRLNLVEVYDAALIDHLADHVFRFSLGGIQAIARSRELAARASENEDDLMPIAKPVGGVPKGDIATGSGMGS